MVLTLPRDIAKEKVSHATEANRPLYFIAANNSSSLLFKNDTVIVITKLCVYYIAIQKILVWANMSMYHYYIMLNKLLVNVDKYLTKISMVLTVIYNNYINEYVK